MTDEQFNPSDHTVDEVNAYLATADEAERQRVLDAEAADKNRSTVKAPEADPEAKVTETKAETFSAAAEATSEPEGEKYQKGYDGFVPSRDGDNPVDLTLAGVTGQKDA